MTQTIIPDRDWYIQKSEEAGVPAKCPYAHHKKCPRNWETTSLLMQAGSIAGLSSEENEAALALWKENMMLPELAEDMTSLNQPQYGGVDGMHRACPEVVSTFSGYYADHFYKYVDDTDRAQGERIKEMESLPNSWRSNWMYLHPVHYLDCEVYKEVKAFNEQNLKSFSESYHKSIKLLLTRMDQALDKKDLGAVIGAAGAAIEALAKVVVDNPKLENKTFGSMKKEFERSSNLPQTMKNLCHDLYILRNSEPNASHGKLKASTVNFEEAVYIASLTKAIVEMEYRLMKK